MKSKRYALEYNQQIGNGFTTDKGAKTILENIDKLRHLALINLRYNYLSKKMLKKLESIEVEFDLTDNQYDCYDWKSPAFAR